MLVRKGGSPAKTYYHGDARYQRNAYEFLGIQDRAPLQNQVGNETQSDGVETE